MELKEYTKVLEQVPTMNDTQVASMLYTSGYINIFKFISDLDKAHYEAMKTGDKSRDRIGSGKTEIEDIEKFINTDEFIAFISAAYAARCNSYLLKQIGKASDAVYRLHAYHTRMKMTESILEYALASVDNYKAFSALYADVLSEYFDLLDIARNNLTEDTIQYFDETTSRRYTLEPKKLWNDGTCNVLNTLYNRLTTDEKFTVNAHKELFECAGKQGDTPMLFVNINTYIGKAAWKACHDTDIYSSREDIEKCREAMQTDLCAWKKALYAYAAGEDTFISYSEQHGTDVCINTMDWLMERRVENMRKLALILSPVLIDKTVKRDDYAIVWTYVNPRIERLDKKYQNILQQYEMTVEALCDRIRLYETPELETILTIIDSEKCVRNPK